MDTRAERVARRFELPVLVAALLVIPVIFIEQSDLAAGWKTAAAIANWAIWLTFAAELVAMLVVLPDRWRWLRSHPLEVAIVVLTPPFFPPSLQATRAFRLLRVIRLLRLAKLGHRVSAADGVRYAGLLALVTVLAGGASFTAVEKGHSTWDGVWWAITTMTTVGYGDISPATTPGRLMAVPVMLVGIGFAAVLTAALAERFLAHNLTEVTDELRDVDETEGDVLDELREIRTRLERLEARLSRS